MKELLQRIARSPVSGHPELSRVQIVAIDTEVWTALKEFRPPEYSWMTAPSPPARQS
jgi:hypothetical protein